MGNIAFRTTGDTIQIALAQWQLVRWQMLIMPNVAETKGFATITMHAGHVWGTGGSEELSGNLHLYNGVRHFATYRMHA